MTKLDTIERYGQKKEPYVCASCGNCTLICPVFNQIKWESYGPRGKLHMLKSTKIMLTSSSDVTFVSIVPLFVQPV
ncbi:MAG: hypothetical protein ACW968_11530 [Candidatus Thorarchaeota archaeon]|jgi:L-lactate utilization protein LutB